MLVLTRKVNESILIGDDIVVTVSEIRGNRIRLAIDAPREIPVMRHEIAAQMGSCLFPLTATPQPQSVPSASRTALRP